MAPEERAAPDAIKLGVKVTFRHGPGFPNPLQQTLELKKLFIDLIFTRQTPPLSEGQSKVPLPV